MILAENNTATNHIDSATNDIDSATTHIDNINATTADTAWDEATIKSFQNTTEDDDILLKTGDVL